MQYINVDSFKRSVEFMAAKDATGNTLSPAEFNNELPKYLNAFISACLGDMRDFGVSRPGFRISDEAIYAVKDSIGHLKTNKFLAVNDGVLTEPLDYMRFSSMRIPAFEVKKVLQEIAANSGECNTKEQKQELVYFTQKKEYWRTVELCEDQMVSKRLDSSLKFPTNAYPIAQRLNSGWQIYPSTINYVLLTYTHYPNKPVWGYTNPSGDEIYDPATSTNIELPHSCESHLIVYFLQAYGIHNQDQFVVNTAEKGKVQS